MKRDAGTNIATVTRVLGVVAVGAAVLGVHLAIPDAVPETLQPYEWSFGAAEQLAVVAAAATLGAVAMAVWSGLTGARAGVAAGTALLGTSWGTLAPTIWADDPRVRGAAFAVTSLLPAALFHLTTALWPHPPALATRAHVRRWLTGTAYVVVGLLGLLHVLSRNPFLDPGCVARCESVTPLIASPWLAGATATGLRFVWVVLGLVAVTVGLTAAVRRLPATSRVPLLVAAGCAAIEVAWALVPGARAAIGPLPLHVPYLLQVRAAAHAALGAALLMMLVVHARRRAAFRRLAREITEVTPPDSIREVIAMRLRDPHTQLAFHIPEEGVWVDELGERVQDPTHPTPAHTATLRREGRVIAQIRFDTPSAAPGDLEEVLGPATLLALEAERTRVEQLLRLRALRETRRQVVDASDAARRRAERDLHDGAQHLLLAATFALQEGLEQAREAGEEARAHLLGRALDEVRGAASELRHVAHGIYPVLLGDAGLVPALEGLARSSPVPTTVDATPVPRFGASGELTAYRAAAIATRTAGNGPLHIAVACDEFTLRMTLRGAVLGADATRSLSDRARALGGTMVSVDTTLRLELPCA